MKPKSTEPLYSSGWQVHAGRMVSFEAPPKEVIQVWRRGIEAVVADCQCVSRRKKDLSSLKIGTVFAVAPMRWIIDTKPVITGKRGYWKADFRIRRN